jgi:hypothetical protein
MPRLSYARLGAIARSRGVRARLDVIAADIAARANAIAAAEGESDNVTVTVSSGTRPRGRPYARVTINADQEWGTTEVERRRILGRAVDSRR